MTKLTKRLLLSLAIGAVMLYLAARGDSFSGAAQALAQARWNVLLPFFACMAAQHLLRAWRWGELLAPIQPVPFRRLLPISTVGFFAILALPLRMGEIVRPYLIAQPPKLRISHGLGTMAVERVIDGLILSLTAFGAVAAAQAAGRHVPSWITGAGVISLILFAVALVVLVLALWQRDRAVALCLRLLTPFSPRIARRAAHIAEGVVDGFSALPDARRLSMFVAVTVVYWLLNGLALQVLAQGFDLDLGFVGGLGMNAIVGIGIMIPAGPGFVGNFELFADGALTLYLPPELRKSRGGAFIIAAHVTNALWYVVTGVLAMFSAHVTFGRVIDASNRGADPTPEAHPGHGG